MSTHFRQVTLIDGNGHERMAMVPADPPTPPKNPPLHELNTQARQDEVERRTEQDEVMVVARDAIRGARKPLRASGAVPAAKAAKPHRANAGLV